MNVEIKKKDDNKYLVIVYDSNGNSTGTSINKNDLYELYIQLREIFKKESV